MTYCDTGHDHGFVPYPYIMTHRSIPFAGVRLALHGMLLALKDGQGIRGDGLAQVIATIHDKLHIRGYHAELSNAQFVANEVEMVFHIAFKILHVFKVMIVRVITYFNVRIFDDVFEKAQALVAFQRIGSIG